MSIDVDNHVKAFDAARRRTEIVIHTNNNWEKELSQRLNKLMERNHCGRIEKTFDDEEKIFICYKLKLI